MSEESEAELKEISKMAAETGMNAADTEAVMSACKALHKLTARVPKNPRVARVVSSIGSRFMSLGQKMGRPLMPPGVGERANES